MDGRGGGGASHGTAAELEKAQGGVERSRFSPGRIEQFKELAADPSVYDKVRRLPSRDLVGSGWVARMTASACVKGGCLRCLL